MDPNLKLATMLIIVALGTVGTTTATAFAATDDEEDDDDSAIETADEAVHAIFGLGSEEMFNSTKDYVQPESVQKH
jgi:hypothetical protein